MRGRGGGRIWVNGNMESMERGRENEWVWKGVSERKEVRRGRESGKRKGGRTDKGGGGVNGWEREERKGRAREGIGSK